VKNGWKHCYLCVVLLICNIIFIYVGAVRTLKFEV
jgi:hypothetical protein